MTIPTKPYLLLLAALLTHASSGALAQGNLIGIYFSTDTSVRCAMCEQYQPISAHVVVTNASPSTIYGYELCVRLSGDYIISACDLYGALNVRQAPEFSCAFTQPPGTYNSRTLLVSLTIIPLSAEPVTIYVEPVSDPSINGATCVADSLGVLYSCTPANGSYAIPAAYVNAATWPCASIDRPHSCWLTCKTTEDVIDLTNIEGGDFLANVSVHSQHLSAIMSAFQVEQIRRVTGIYPDTFQYYDEATQSLRTYRSAADLFHFVLPDSTLIATMLDSLHTCKHVIYADRVVHGQYDSDNETLPNDRYISNYVANANNTLLTSDSARAWDLWRRGGSYNPVIVGVLDSGVDWLHGDLQGKYAGGATTFDTWHGTATAGIIAAARDNDYAIPGIADCNVHAYQFADGPTNIGLEEGLRTLREHNIRIANASFGLADSPIAKNACAEYYNANGIVVASAGNNGSTLPQAPAAYAGVIGVGSVRSTDGARCTISNYGINTDVVAVADTLFLCVPVMLPNMLEDHCVKSTTGATSFAAPQVAAAATVLLEMRPALYNDDVMMLIKLSAAKAPLFNYSSLSSHYGHGLLQLGAAVDSMGLNALRGISAGQCSRIELVSLDTVTVEGLAPIADWDTVEARMYRVERDYDIAPAFQTAPHVWGRGVGTTGALPIGMNLQSYANFDISRYCGVDDAQTTASRCVLVSYLYRFRRFANGDTVWYPSTPSSMQWNAAALGRDGVTASPGMESLSEDGLSAWPNPFNAKVCIGLAGEYAGTDKVAIYDIRGRHIATIEAVRQADGSALAEWGGCTDEGRVCASGKYIARVRTASRTAMKMISLVK